MVGDLIGYFAAPLLVVLTWRFQRLHDWWTQPDRAWRRKLWLIEHDLQAWLSRLERGSAGTSSEPHPAPGRPTSRSGAGPQPQTAVEPLPPSVEALPPGGLGQHLAAGVCTGGQAQQPVDVLAPDLGVDRCRPIGDLAGGEQGCESGLPTFGPGGPANSNSWRNLAQLGERP